MSSEAAVTGGTGNGISPAAYCSTGALEKALLKIKELRINFVAIDFDSTLIDIHTGGS